MQSNKIVRYQKIDKVKSQRAKNLRRTLTAAEKVLWNNVRDGRICGVKIRRQQVIDGFIADFYCNKARLIIEVDGSIHGREDRRRYDEQRKKIMEAHGLIELRFSNDEISKNIKHVLRSIEDAVSQRIAGIEDGAVDDSLLLKEKGRG